MKPCELLVFCILCTFAETINTKTVRNSKAYNRCPKVTIPNGTMVLKFRGRVAKFTCDPGYQLIGDRIATCQQRNWDNIPVCVEKVKCPVERPKVLNGMMITYKFVYFKMVCNPGYNVSEDSQTVFPCEEFRAPNNRQLICQLTEKNFCDFEEGMCGWNNTIPYFSWIRHQNATPSHDLHTGPSSDHTTGTGHYLYIEASGLSEYEERFAKLTRRFSKIDTPEVCFVFWYHMYGFNIGTLDVYVDYRKVFTKTGNLGNKWRKGIIQNLPSEHDFYISFVATTANGFAGDIAIDDIGLVNSTDCAKTLLVERSCRYRCFDPETNATLCKCSSECLIESTCCEDFVRYCSLEPYETTIRSAKDETSDYTFTDRDTTETQSSDVDTSVYPTNQGFSTDVYESVTNFFTRDDSSIKYESTLDGVVNPSPTPATAETTFNTDSEYFSTQSYDATYSKEEFNDIIKITEPKNSRFARTTVPTRQSAPDSKLRATSNFYTMGEYDTTTYEAQSEEPILTTNQEATNSGLIETSNSYPMENSEYDTTVEPGTETSFLEVKTSVSRTRHTKTTMPSLTESTTISPQKSSNQLLSLEAKKKLPSSISNKTTTRSKIESRTSITMAWPTTLRTTQKPRVKPEFQPPIVTNGLAHNTVKQYNSANTTTKSIITHSTTTTPRVNRDFQLPNATTESKKDNKYIKMNATTHSIRLNTTNTTANPKAEQQSTKPTTRASIPTKNQTTISTVTAKSTEFGTNEAMLEFRTTGKPAASRTDSSQPNPFKTYTSRSIDEYETESNPRHNPLEEDAVRAVDPADSEEYHDMTEAIEQTPKLTSTRGSYRSTVSSRLAVRTPIKWKSIYVPKGRYTFSAVKSESHTKAYVSISIGILLFLSAAVLTGYLFSRRRRSTPRRLRDDMTEESDVLYMTADEVLNFNVGLPRPQSSHQGKQRKGDRKQLSPSSSDVSL